MNFLPQTLHWHLLIILNLLIIFEPVMGVEPTAYWLQISCTTIVLHRQIYLVGRGGIEPPLSDFQSDALTNFATFPIVRFDKENVQTHLGLYIMSLLKFLQDYPWQCSNTRYYSGLTLTLTGPKINFNLNTLPNPFIYFSYEFPIGVEPIWTVLQTAT